VTATLLSVRRKTKGVWSACRRQPSDSLSICALSRFKKATIKRQLGKRSLHPDHHRRLAPELLQAVVLSQTGGENVDDHIAVVNQHPSRRGNPLNVQRDNPCFLFHLFQDFVHDSSNLPFAGSAADDKVVGQQGNPADVQQDDVGALLVGDEFNYSPGQLRRIWFLRSYAQKSTPFRSPRYVYTLASEFFKGTGSNILI